MYLTRFLFSLFALLLIGLLSCKDEEVQPDPFRELECEPAKIYLDTVFLDAKSISYVSYNGNEVLVFKNASGDEVRFVPLYDLSISYHLFKFNLDCLGGDINHYEYKAEQYAVSKKCIDLNLELSINLYPFIKAPAPLFYDQFRIALYPPPLDFEIDTSINLSITTSLKGNPEPPDPYSWFTLAYKYSSDTTLLNVTFQDVYYNVKTISDPPNSLFYTKELGLIAFTDLDDVLWVFDRFE